MTALGRSLPVITKVCAVQIECKRLVSTDAIDWSVAMQMGGQVHAITHRNFAFIPLLIQPTNRLQLLAMIDDPFGEA